MTTEPSTLRYACAGASVSGLAERGWLKSEGKYFLKVKVDGRDEWQSREIRTKESRVIWDTEEDVYHFECTPSATLVVTPCKSHSSGPTEDLGAAQARVEEWLRAGRATSLVSHATSESKSFIEVKLFLSPSGTAPAGTPVPASAPPRLEAGMDAYLGGVVGTTTTSARSMAGVGGIAESSGSGAKDLQHGRASPWEPLLDHLEWFVSAMDKATEVHPYAKMAWGILSAAYKVVRAQQNRDDKIHDLVDTMNRVYAFLHDAQDLPNLKAREGVLSRLTLQTIDCAFFISSYARESNFWIRLVYQGMSKVDERIEEYVKSFGDLLEEFRLGSHLRTEIVTTRILEDLHDAATEFDLEKIPYTGGAGYEPSKQCLANTRTSLLEEITTWVDNDDPPTPGVFVLLGPAGMGKSTVAHTIAHRFRTIERLGASFCFSTVASTSRQPVDLFRTMARDLAAFHPAFKSALRASIGRDLRACTTEDLSLQFEKFILEPAKALAVNGSILIMIDAFDESGTVAQRKTLLSILRDRLRELPSAFRFLITSREEADVQKAFYRSTEHVLVKRMPTVQEDKHLNSDILLYIQHRLSGGRRTSRRSIIYSVHDLSEQVGGCLPVGCSRLQLYNGGYPWLDGRGAI